MAAQLVVCQPPCSPSLKSLTLSSLKVDEGSTEACKPKAKLQTSMKQEVVEIADSPVQRVKKQEILDEKLIQMKRVEFLKQLS